MSHDRKMITAIFCIENKNLPAWWSPTGKPLAPLAFADSLRERRGLVVRHTDHRRIHPRLKP
jgi:hypothetical protein